MGKRSSNIGGHDDDGNEHVDCQIRNGYGDDDGGGGGGDGTPT